MGIQPAETLEPNVWRESEQMSIIALDRVCAQCFCCLIWRAK